MPPQAPPYPLSQKRSPLRYVGVALLLVIILLGVWWFLSKPSSLTWGATNFQIQSASTNQAYAFSGGEFKESEIGTASPAIFAPTGWPAVAFEQRADGIYACSSETCERIIDLGDRAVGQAAYAVDGSTLVLVNPISKAFQAYELIPANPVRVRLLYSVANTVMPEALALAADPAVPGRYLFLTFLPAGESGELRVCSASFDSSTQALLPGTCESKAISSAAFPNPTIAPLP